jgi:hypothetical protein
MDQEHTIAFGPFRLETTQGRLWQGDHRIPLRPRSLAMLSYLVAHPGRLVTKAEVQQHVWGGTHVTDTVLRVSVQEIRAALGDAAGAPRYLATVGRQGYRWLGGGALEEPPPRPASLRVGRQGEVALLEGWYQQAAQGTRQLVFISGEAGVGKTTVVEMALARRAAGGGGRTAPCLSRSAHRLAERADVAGDPAGEPHADSGRILEFLRQLGSVGLPVCRRGAALSAATSTAFSGCHEVETVQPPVCLGARPPPGAGHPVRRRASARFLK